MNALISQIIVVGLSAIQNPQAEVQPFQGPELIAPVEAMMESFENEMIQDFETYIDNMGRSSAIEESQAKQMVSSID